MAKLRVWICIALTIQMGVFAYLLNTANRDYQAQAEAPPASVKPAPTATVEATAEANPELPPFADPLAAWAVARQLVPEGNWVRRIAFAGHGFFVFFGPDGSAEINASFVGWRDGRYQLDRIDPASPRDSDICKAPGVSADLVEPAIRSLLQDPTYLKHQHALDGLYLECYQEQPFWLLMPIPPEGYQAGSALQTIELPLLQLERSLPQ